MSVEYPNAHVQQFLLVFATVLDAIAIALTSLRLWIRVRLHRFWWEDAWAALALCLAVLCAVSTWMLTPPERGHPWYKSHESHIALVWLTSLSYTCLIWAARTSIVFSSIRIVPPGRMRTMVNGVAVVFFLLWALCVASVAYTCGSDKSWHDHPDIQCWIGFSAAIIALTADVIADVTLIVLPLGILWGLRLPRDQRMIVLVILSMSSLSVMASIAHLVFLIPTPGYTASVTADIEGALDLVICNLLVLVSSAYRVFRSGEDIGSTENDATAKPPGSSSLQMTVDTLTTVDLERFETMTIRSTQSAPVLGSETVFMGRLSLRSSCDVTV